MLCITLLILFGQVEQKLSQSFRGYNNVKTPVIPFISSCLASMSGLTAINRPLQGSCTGSPDYIQATAQYPSWF